MQKLATFFAIPIDHRLLNTSFEELLTAELPDADRYQRVEKKIRPAGQLRK